MVVRYRTDCNASISGSVSPFENLFWALYNYPIVRRFITIFFVNIFLSQFSVNVENIKYTENIILWQTQVHYAGIWPLCLGFIKIFNTFNTLQLFEKIRRRERNGAEEAKKNILIFFFFFSSSICSFTFQSWVILIWYTA